MTNNENTQYVASEFHWDEKKILNKIVGEWNPNFKANEEFKNKLDKKIQDKIILTQHHRQEQAELDAVPRRLKWRFYITWYGYAIVSFVALFLIWFCTNIFTWTLKVPTKYTYLDENKAFWELAYNYDVNKASNFYYDGTDIDENIEIEESSVEVPSESRNFFSKAIDTQVLWKTTAATESFITAADLWVDESLDTYWDYLLNDWFTYNQTYRFAYKNKLFPKLNPEYPVYKSSWVLMWSNHTNQVLKNLKIWNVSFKNFQDLDIMNIEMEQSVENWYNIYFDNRGMKLYFYPNSSWKSSEYLWKIPSNKQILKSVEKDLKNLWVSLKNYWEWIVDVENIDENMWMINIFYPFIIQWKTVRDTQWDTQVWVHVVYDLNLQKVVSIVWIDIATYDVSNYPTLDKDIITSEIEKWWNFYNQWALHEDSTVILLDSMELVYTETLLNWEVLYVPTIRATISTSIENYVGPSTIYEEII